MQPTDLIIAEQALREKSEVVNTPVVEAEPQFRNFPKLAVELQNMIFTEAALQVEPRVIEICEDLINEGDKFISKCTVPALMEFGLGSRGVARKFYSELPTKGAVRFSKDTFVNWEQDVIFLGNFWQIDDLAELGENMVTTSYRNMGFLARDAKRILQYPDDFQWAGLEKIEHIILIHHFKGGDPYLRQTGVMKLKAMDEVSRSGISPLEATKFATDFLAKFRHKAVALKTVVAMDAYRDTTSNYNTQKGRRAKQKRKEKEAEAKMNGITRITQSSLYAAQ